MRQIRSTLDRMATLAALRLLAWVGKRVDPAQQLWLEALRAELDAIDGGIARLVWAVGGLRLIWFERRQHMVNATYRYGPVLLPGLEAALFVGLTLSLIQHYGSLVVILLELAGLGLVVAVPVLIALVHVIRTRVPTRRAGARGYLLKGVDQAEVLLAINTVSSGEAIFSKLQVASRAEAIIHARDDGLT